MAVEFDSCIRGYHVYKDVWTPTIDEVLPCRRETTNEYDPFAVMVEKSEAVVGHLPRKISSTCSLFLSKGGSISCRVSGTRQYSADLVQGGLVVPCVLIFISRMRLCWKSLKRCLLCVR